MTICLPVLAISCWFWPNKNFESVKWGRSYELWRHATDTLAIFVACAENAIWDEKNLPSGIICGSSMQQYLLPRPVSSESMFSFQLSGLRLFTWHVKCFAINNLAPPIAALHDGRTAGSGERCLKAELPMLPVAYSVINNGDIVQPVSSFHTPSWSFRHCVELIKQPAGYQCWYFGLANFVPRVQKTSQLFYFRATVLTLLFKTMKIVVSSAERRVEWLLVWVVAIWQRCW